MRILTFLPCAGLLLCGCAYDPPLRGDHEAAAYRKDLAACQAVAEQQADLAVKQRGYLFVTYPISWPIELRVHTRTCMQGKGYVLES